MASPDPHSLLARSDVMNTTSVEGECLWARIPQLQLPPLMYARPS